MSSLSPDRRLRWLLALGIVLTVGAGFTLRHSTIAQESTGLPAVPPETIQQAGNWPVPQGNLAATRDAAGASISAATVNNLEVAWTFDLTAAGFYGAITANPIVVGDVVYVQDMQSNIFALDRTGGAVIWRTDFGIGSIGPNGVAVGYGLVYAGLSDAGEVVALDAATGAEVWRQKIGSPPGEAIDMAPMVYGGQVYISTVPISGLGSFYAGGDRGILYVLDALTGEVAWSFDTTTDNVWGNPKGAGGGGLWYPPSFDDAGNIYFGVGNPSPWPLTPECPNGECRPGDNLYTSAMVSLAAETGGVRWHYQDRPHDLFDHDFQNTPVLASITIDGAETPIAIGSGKTGNVVAVQADTGVVLWKTPVGKHQNDDLTELPADEYLEIYPGFFGGVETPIAFADGVVYATYVDLPQYQNATGSDPNRGIDFSAATGGLVAIDAADGSIVWDTYLPTFVVGAATVADDLVFTAGLDGFFRAFDVATGQEVWSYEAEAGINAPPAIAGDMIFVGAGFVKLPQVGAATPETAESAEPQPQLIALRIGGAAASTPSATESADGTPDAGATKETTTGGETAHQARVDM